MCFAREVILANGVEGRLAIAYASTIDIIERRCLVSVIYLSGHVAGARSEPEQAISMISLEYWFRINSSGSL
jgi:hypothetical protein